jgi:hypothetical protein
LQSQPFYYFHIKTKFHPYFLQGLCQEINRQKYDEYIIYERIAYQH